MRPIACKPPDNAAWSAFTRKSGTGQSSNFGPGSCETKRKSLRGACGVSTFSISEDSGQVPVSGDWAWCFVEGDFWPCYFNPWLMTELPVNFIWLCEKESRQRMVRLDDVILVYCANPNLNQAQLHCKLNGSGSTEEVPPTFSQARGGSPLSLPSAHFTQQPIYKIACPRKDLDPLRL